MIFENIKKLCDKKKITINFLEKSTGLGAGTIHYWRRSEPSVFKLKKVADYLGVSVESLLK